MVFLNRLLNKYVFDVKPGMFRLFLAILVVLHHSLRLFPFGSFAVFTFFILSGYWVGRMYDEFYSKRKNGYLLFICSRVLRLYPLYLLCTVLMLLVCKFIIYDHYHQSLIPPLGVKDYLFLGLMVPLNQLDFKLLGPAWSLAVEMQFYIIAPLIILLIKKMNSILLLVISLAISVYFICNKYDGFAETVFRYFIYFIAGMLIYFKSLKVSRKQVLVSLLCIFLILLLSYSVPALRLAFLYPQKASALFWYHDVFSYVMPFFFIPLIIHNLSQKSNKLDRHFGDFSYTIYLVHWIVFSIYYVAYPGAGFNREKLVAFGVTLLATVAVSLFIYYFFEKRVEIFRNKLIKSSK